MYAEREKNDSSRVECRFSRSRTVCVHGRIAQITPLRLKSLSFLPEHILYHDDGVQAMERLKSVYLLAMIALAAVPAVGQQTSPHEPSNGTVAVVGDIELFDTLFRCRLAVL